MFQNLPLYAGFMAASFTLLVGSALIFSLITPYDEIKLIRAGNKGAGIAFAGTLIALGIVINSIASSTHNLIELAVWSGVGLLIQLIAFFLLRLVFPNLFTKIPEEGCEAHGFIIAGFSIGVALLNAGALYSPS